MANFTGRKGWFTRYIQRIYPMACAGDPVAQNDLRAFARRSRSEASETKRKYRVGRTRKLLLTDMKATALLLGLMISVVSASDGFGGKLVCQGWRTNQMVSPNVAMRGDVSVPITNVASRVYVYRLGPKLPLFTNTVAFSTNVVWTKPPLKPIKSPKFK